MDRPSLVEFDIASRTCYRTRYDDHPLQMTGGVDQQWRQHHMFLATKHTIKSSLMSNRGFALCM